MTADEKEARRWVNLALSAARSTTPGFGNRALVTDEMRHAIISFKLVAIIAGQETPNAHRIQLACEMLLQMAFDETEGKQ